MGSIVAVRIIDKKPTLSTTTIPTPAENEILIKVEAAALNPTDWKHAAYVPVENTVSGCDVAGVVEKVGSKVTSAKVGDRVAGFTHGSNVRNTEVGGFAEYTLLVDHIYAHIPKSVSAEEASPWGIQISTVGFGLYKFLNLPLPDPSGKISSKNEYFLVWGGATSVGYASIQFAHLSGYKVVATASPKNFKLLESIGAEKVFDYRDPKVSDLIRSYTNDTLSLAIDTISEEKSYPKVNLSFGKSGGKFATLLPISTDKLRHDVKTNEFSEVLAYTVLQKRIEVFGVDVPPRPKDKELGDKVWKLFETLVAKGLFKLQPIEILPKGLESISTGFKRLEEGDTNGKKLVVRISDTPSLKK